MYKKRISSIYTAEQYLGFFGSVATFHVFTYFAFILAGRLLDFLAYSSLHDT